MCNRPILGTVVSPLANPIDGNFVLDVLVRAAILVGIVAPCDRLGADRRRVIEACVELFVASDTLLLVATLEAAIIASVAIGITQDSYLRACAVRIWTRTDKTNAP